MTCRIRQRVGPARRGQAGTPAVPVRWFPLFSDITETDFEHSIQVINLQTHETEVALTSMHGDLPLLQAGLR